MSRVLAVFLLLAGCDLDSLQWANEGRLDVGGTDCVIDAPTSVGYGFCLDADGVFAASGDGDCGEVTVWMDSARPRGGGEVQYSAQADSNSLEGGQAAVWVKSGGESYTSTQGSVTLLERTDGNVAVSFEVQLETFIGGDPGPSATGMVICED